MAAAGGRAFAVPLDVLVNNAGLGENHDALDVTEADWDALMDVNLKGVWLGCKAGIPAMLRSGGGSIVLNPFGRSRES